MLPTSIFNEQEIIVLKRFNQEFSYEIALFLELLNAYSKSIESNDLTWRISTVHKKNVMSFLTQNVNLLNSSIQNLSIGSLRVSETLIRSAVEDLILSIYFIEFPEAESQYRELNYRDFLKTHKIEKMLKKVHDKEEGIFIKRKTETKYLHKILYGIYAEASKFSHTDIKTINQLMTSHSLEDIVTIGPVQYEKVIVEKEIFKLLNVAYISYLTWLISFDIILSDQEKELLQKVFKFALTNPLNIKNSGG